ncbi:MAG: ATP-binding protein [bacterium]
MDLKTITQKKTLRWRIIITLLTVSLLPLVVAGLGGGNILGKLLEQKALEQMRIIVQDHAKAIESTLSNRMNLLRLLASSHTLEAISNNGNLQDFLKDLNQSSDGGFVDLGVIDINGNHLAYVGPYELKDKNYSQTDWFKEVLANGVYVSDVFLGYRQVPHCIIAVKGMKGQTPWVLRATINSQQFDELVKTGFSGKRNDVYIVNQEGFYQTTPRSGTLLDKSPLDLFQYHPGVKDHRITQNDTTKIIVTSWVNSNRWILVVEQELAIVLEPVNQAITHVARYVILAVVLLIITTFIATWNLTNQIDKATAERDRMTQAFVRSAKLASIGELATGLAHEINNPLAIISAEQTNISDLISEMENYSENSEQIIESVDRCKKQVQRCGSITRKMLQFGRKQESQLVMVDIAPGMLEIINLLERHANVRNVKIESEIDENLPQVMIDPIELEQVLVNLINNAIDALPNGGQITVKAYTLNNTFCLDVIDNGVGISQEVQEKIFEPFFTTKPVGKGTGLGLSVCYGIVNAWGGDIKVESTENRGTRISIILPLQSDKKAKKTE